MRPWPTVVRMAETAAQRVPRPMGAEVGGPGSRPLRIALLVVAGCGALALACVGWFLGAASLTAVEPGGLFVDCGPALFGRPERLPDALCADAYFPLPAVSILLLAGGVLGAVVCLGLLLRDATSSAPRL